MADLGLTLPNGCRIVHGTGSNIKHPFPDLPMLEMHELDPGVSSSDLANSDSFSISNGEPQTPKPRAFHGQFGFIPFNTSIRLPRHVHIGLSLADPDRKVLVAERILVLNGVAMVELNGQIYVIPSGALVTIAPGVPHTWTACPAGVRIPGSSVDGSGDGGEEVSTGQFLMVYEYEAPTGFFPTRSTETLKGVEGYEEFEGSLDEIRFPELRAVDVVRNCKGVWGRELAALGLAS